MNTNLWDATVDKRYLCQLTEVSDDKGASQYNLSVIDTQLEPPYGPLGQLIHSEPCSLDHEPRFGLDFSDRTRVMKRCLEVIDHPDQRMLPEA